MGVGHAGTGQVEAHLKARFGASASIRFGASASNSDEPGAIDGTPSESLAREASSLAPEASSLAQEASVQAGAINDGSPPVNANSSGTNDAASASVTNDGASASTVERSATATNPSVWAANRVFALPLEAYRAITVRDMTAQLSDDEVGPWGTGWDPDPDSFRARARIRRVQNAERERAMAAARARIGDNRRDRSNVLSDSAAERSDFFKRHPALQWYEELANQKPPTLQHSARCAIRSAIGSERMRGIHQLQLPMRIRRYLLLDAPDAIESEGRDVKEGVAEVEEVKEIIFEELEEEKLVELGVEVDGEEVDG